MFDKIDEDHVALGIEEKMNKKNKFLLCAFGIIWFSIKRTTKEVNVLLFFIQTVVVMFNLLDPTI
jgi:hypothetical protein